MPEKQNWIAMWNILLELSQQVSIQADSTCLWNNVIATIVDHLNGTVMKDGVHTLMLVMLHGSLLIQNIDILLVCFEDLFFSLLCVGVKPKTCPQPNLASHSNIPGCPPLSYSPATGLGLASLLHVPAKFFWLNTSLTISVKLLLYIVHVQIMDIVK